MRLDALVCCTLQTNKAQALRLIASGAVRVQPLNVCPRDPSFQVVLEAEWCERAAPDGDCLSPPLKKRAKVSRRPEPFHRLLIMHKPPGYVSERARGSASWLKSHGHSRIVKGGRADRTHGAKSVYDIIPDELAHSQLGAFGRLDKGTTGLLLFGTDGGLNALLTHPTTSLPKRYEAVVKRRSGHGDEGGSGGGGWCEVACEAGPAQSVLDAGAAEAFARGVKLADGTHCRPAKLAIIESGFLVRRRLLPATTAANATEALPTIALLAGGNEKAPHQYEESSPRWGKMPETNTAEIQHIPVLRVSLTLHEGVYHQVKRMLGTQGGHVISLHRVAVGPFDLSGLAEGRTRRATAEEIASLSALLPQSAESRCRTARREVSGRRGTKDSGRSEERARECAAARAARGLRWRARHRAQSAAAAAAAAANGAIDTIVTTEAAIASAMPSQ